MEKVSVIVPVYNVEAYINRTLESICGQTYRNLEILLIDDGSSDESLACCMKWAEKDNRIRVYHQENIGVSMTRNRGLEQATGDYIMFMDADDIIEKNMIEALHTVLIENDADVACCTLQENSVSDEVKYGENICENYRDKVQIGTTQTESGLLFLKVWGPVCKLYRKAVLTGMQFEQLEVAEDLLFNTEVICSGRLQRAALIEYPFYHYIIYPGSAMKQKFQQKYLTAVEVEKRCYDMLTAVSTKFADINLIGCSVSRVFEKYAQLSKEERKAHKADFAYCKKFAKAHKDILLAGTDRHRRISGALKVYVPDLYLWSLIRRYKEK